MPPQDSWSNHYLEAQFRPHSHLVESAAKACTGRRHVLDLGAGSLNDCKFLLQEGFWVHAVDSEPDFARMAKLLKRREAKFTFEQTDFKDLILPEDHYQIVVGIQSLNFCRADKFDAFMDTVTASVEPMGKFVGVIYGERDDYRRMRPSGCYPSEQKLSALFARGGMEIIAQTHDEYDDPASEDFFKHRHMIYLAAVRTKMLRGPTLAGR